ncbi:hypothetical protein [Methylocystis sp. ATCC 49242]|uniref:hypothetical protein n=1 Tax=Methylocystis sp. ATCC 49242 TaxID=622637 RepID=UPI0001F879E2|nr:hypothetical protein [Methylocystis sp. ATCC 49242]
MTKQAFARLFLGGAAALIFSVAGAFAAGCVEAIRLMTISGDYQFLAALARMDPEALKFLLFVGMIGAIVSIIISLPSIVFFYLANLLIARVAKPISKRTRALVSFGAAIIFAMTLLPLQVHLGLGIKEIDFAGEITAIIIIAPIAARIFWKIARLSRHFCVISQAAPSS